MDAAGDMTNLLQPGLGLGLDALDSAVEAIGETKHFMAKRTGMRSWWHGSFWEILEKRLFYGEQDPDEVLMAWTLLTHIAGESRVKVFFTRTNPSLGNAPGSCVATRLTARKRLRHSFR